MKLKQQKWFGRAIGAALLAGSLGACDFIDVTETDPNIVSVATLDQLWVGVQVNTFVFAEGQIARLAGVFTQQIAGVDRQFALLDQYIFGEGELDDEFAQVYTGGGLIDINRGEFLADSVECAPCKGLFQIQEAYLIGMTSSIFGDIPFSEAGSTEVNAPKLDQQDSVYLAVQATLDNAISNLANAPSGAGAAFYAQMASADLNFGGNRARWIAVAWTLKARFYLHWVRAQLAGGQFLQASQVACQGNCIEKAQAAALKGIMDPAGNFRGIHSTTSTEQNFFFQFFRDRAGYVTASGYLVELLKARNDPRLPIYFSPNKNAEFVGSRPGQPNADASIVSTLGVGAPNYNQPIVTCAETFFILAETYYYQGKTQLAQEALQAGVRCQERWFNSYPSFAGNVQIPIPGQPLTGRNLLQEIIVQKHIALFLNAEVYNDYRRTCLPNLQTANNRLIPRRILYGRTERITNPNIPEPSQQPLRNRNDPPGLGTDRGGLTGIACGGQ